MTTRRLLLTSALTVAAMPALAQNPLQPLLNLFATTEVGADTFVQQAAYGDMFEIESSRTLLAGSTHRNLREFAQKMINEHTMLSTEMRSIPDAVTRMPTGLDSRRSNKLLELRQHEGDMLNRWYVQQQIEAHEEAVLLYETYANNGEVPLLKAFAQKHLPMIRSHLTEVRAFQAPQSQG